MDLMTRRMDTGKQRGWGLNSWIYSDVLKKTAKLFIYLAMQYKYKAMVGQTDIPLFYVW